MLHKHYLVVVPNALDRLVCSKVSLLALSVAQVVFPESFKKQGILLIHQETLTMSLVFLEHADVSRALLGILQPSHAVVVSLFELTNVLCDFAGHLAKALRFHVPKLSSIHCDSVPVVVDSLAVGFAVLPHAIVHFLT